MQPVSHGWNKKTILVLKTKSDFPEIILVKKRYLLYYHKAK